MGGSSGSSGGSGGNRTAIQRLVAGAGGLRNAQNQLNRDASNRIGNRLDAVSKAYSGVSPGSRLATQIATGQATRGASSGYSQRLPPIHVTVTKHPTGRVTTSIGDGRHRLHTARAMGASHIRARVTYVHKGKTGKQREYAKQAGTMSLKI